MADQMKMYRGSCHCGAYVYEVKAAVNPKVGECNCTYCYKRATLWLSYKEDDIRFVKGDPHTLTSYTFGKKNLLHKFCSTCGIQLSIEGIIGSGEGTQTIRSVNARSIQHGQGIDVWKVEKFPINGQTLGPAYVPPRYTGPEPKDIIEGGRLYTGSCHCGALRVAFRSKPLDKSSAERIIECNCSICIRQGAVYVSPPKEAAGVEGEENLQVYLFGGRKFGKGFCRTCGVPVYNPVQPITEEQVGQMPQEGQQFVRWMMKTKQINVRLVDELNVKDLNVEQFDGYDAIKPAYVEP
ncbi:glutathione-dependent formaldehyde-activating enzyme [Hypoxylon sp. FL1284]|nr:glutathione-dependent formaldehyde-activating enzyme [Hypoxylon sp. FL1284]